MLTLKSVTRIPMPSLHQDVTMDDELAEYKRLKYGYKPAAIGYVWRRRPSSLIVQRDDGMRWGFISPSDFKTLFRECIEAIVFLWPLLLTAFLCISLIYYLR
mgnify:CR=1 FL=1